jgi:hypothetical protein
MFSNLMKFLEYLDNNLARVMAQPLFTNQCVQVKSRKATIAESMTRAIMKAPIQLGGSEDSIVAFIDH